MFAPRRLAAVVVTVLAMLMCVLAPGQVSAEPGAGAKNRPAASKVERSPNYSWTPAPGVTFNIPDTAQKRAILAKVIQSIRSTRPGRVIRMAMWNFDDKPARIELINAHKRGVSVQMVVSAQVDNPNFTLLKAGLARKSPNAKKQKVKSFAKQCRAGCRTAPGKGIMHTKFFLFSEVGKAKNISMFGSVNLTTAAGNRQWNDLTTVTNNWQLYRQYTQMFTELRSDQQVRPPYQVRDAGSRFRIHVFPLKSTDQGGPILRDLKLVQCKGVARGYGNGAGRTKIRIAIAGWFDEYGARIARQVRRLWNQGCDVKIVNTLTGRGINKALRDRSGRGPVPNREVTVDRNYDGIPERYLHLKFYTVDGVYNGKSTRVYFTGSANWSARSTRSDEMYVRVFNGGWTRRYADHVDRLYSGPAAHRSVTMSTRAIPGMEGIRRLEPHEIYDPKNDHLVPDWFETD